MVKHPNTRVTIAKVGNINVANCNAVILSMVSQTGPSKLRHLDLTLVLSVRIKLKVRNHFHGSTTLALAAPPSRA